MRFTSGLSFKTENKGLSRSLSLFHVVLSFQYLLREVIVGEKYQLIKFDTFLFSDRKHQIHTSIAFWL